MITIEQLSLPFVDTELRSKKTEQDEARLDILHGKGHIYISVTQLIDEAERLSDGLFTVNTEDIHRIIKRLKLQKAFRAAGILFVTKEVGREVLKEFERQVNEKKEKAIKEAEDRARTCYLYSHLRSGDSDEVGLHPESRSGESELRSSDSELCDG